MHLIESKLPEEQLCGLRMLIRLGTADDGHLKRTIELVAVGRSKVARSAMRLLRGRSDDELLARLGRSQSAPTTLDVAA